MGKFAKRIFYSGLILVVSWFLLIATYPFTAFWRKKFLKQPRDTSWEFGRKLIYDQGISYWKELLLDFRLDIQNKNILEVGCGNGQWLIALDDLEARDVTGVEPNDEVRKYCLNRLQEYDKDGRIRVEKASAEFLPYPDVSFDCVLCMGVFMFTKQSQALNEFKRVLRPNGQLMLTVNGLGYMIMKAKDGILFSRINEIRYGLSGIVASLIKWGTGYQVGTCAINVAEMKSMFKEHGFDLQRVWLHNNIDLYPLEHFAFPTNYAFRAIKKI